MALEPQKHVEYDPHVMKSCYEKVRYESESSASKARKRNLETYGALQQIYYCGVCYGYHLTTVAHRRF